MSLLPDIRLEDPVTSWSLRNPAPGVVLGVCAGKPRMEHGRQLLDYEEKAIGQHPDGLWILHDWNDATGYEPGVRDLLVKWNRKHEKDLYRVEIVFKSRLVSMAVAVASIASPYIHVVSTVDELHARIARAVAERSR